MNGHAIVMLCYPEIKMPAACIQREQLIDIILEYDRAEDSKSKKEAASASAPAAAARSSQKKRKSRL